MTSAAQEFVDKFNADYEAKHEAFENQFWGTKMNLSSTATVVYSAENLNKTKTAMEGLLADPSVREKAENFRAELPESEEGSDLAKTLDIIIRTCNCYELPSPEAKKIREETGLLESKLEMARNSLKLGYTATDGTFVEQSSVGLRNKIRTDTDDAIRKSCYEGLRSIGDFVLNNGFVEIIKFRNKLAKSLGYLDYYDYKVTNAEGFGKVKLFAMLDDLEKGTREIMEKAREELAARFGQEALEPWNTGFKMAGSIVAKMDPYFPFSKSVERYMRTYAALGITYRGATMNLDLLDRPHKYSNGFCHWPRPAWKKSDGTWQPSVTNFTSLADPAAVGSGFVGLTTLMHEAGHASHMANIDQPSPLFSQERAPMSVAYAENQSMFLDSLVSDAAWRAKYAKNEAGESIPFKIIEEEIRATHPFAVFQLRAMLSVSYFEKALYELPESEVTAENIKALADKVEVEIQGGFSARPLLSIPHLVSDEASCYYHGYTLAEMAVHQTREFFLTRDGVIVDNNKVGPEITEGYWKCGNSRPFLEIVKELTGKELSGKPWVDVLKETVDEKVERERKEYDDSLKAGVSSDQDINLDMTVKFVDGDEVIADSSNGGLLSACSVFENFVSNRVKATA